jgi:lipoprotein-releasing system permease protein
VVYLLKVVGIYKSGLGAIDNVRSYVSLNTAQKLLQKDKTYITDISLKLKNRDAAVAKAIEYSNLFDVKAESWKEANAVFEQGTLVRNIMTYVVSITLLIVAGFGIYNIISMNVHNKIKDIAILKATGFSGKDVVRIFMMQAMMIGFIGALTGITIGFFLSLAISKIPFTGGEFAAIDHFPVKFNPVFYIFGITFGIITTLVAAFLPSRKAAKVDPVVILRG